MSDQDQANKEAEAASSDEQLSSNGGQGVHASDRNSAQAAAAVDSISPPTGTVKPDASARGDHTAESQLRHADEHDDREEKHYPAEGDKAADAQPDKEVTEPAPASGSSVGSSVNAPALNPDDEKNDEGIRAGSDADQGTGDDKGTEGVDESEKAE